MSRFLEHFLRRSKELGPLGMLQRVWMRSVTWIVVSLRSLWWGWISRRDMSDSSLMARTNGNWRTVEELLVHLANRPATSFLLPHADSRETAQLLDLYYPEYLAKVFAVADAACKNKISLLGQTFHYSNAIDWQRDPVTDWQWPLKYRDRMSVYVGTARPLDLIFFWELNRHQHYISLGIAYWLTGNQRYAHTFISQFQSWIDTNPLRHGMNWFYPLEISIRLLAWTTAFQFFRNSPEFQQKAGKAFLKSIWQQADFVHKNLQPIRSKEDVPNNHMMAELVGLILVATIFPEFRSATEWRETGLRFLTQQANVQTYPDGIHKEQAMGYHRFVAELLLLIVAHGKRGRIRREPILEKTLEKMFDYVLYSTGPDGTSPMWGDSDFGRALGLGQQKDFWDFRPLLSTGAVLFERSDWKYVAVRFDEESFWLLGPEGINLWNQIEPHQPEQTSYAFPQGGHYIIRDSWTSDTDIAFFRCGPFGLGGEKHCAHAHSDLLSFTLWIHGQPLLIDSGTYLYHGSMRDYFRLSTAHNTVMVDNNHQAIPEPNFNWQKVTDAQCIAWTGDQVTGAFDFPGVKFVRKLSHPQPGVWLLEDSFLGNGEHKFEWLFNFAPGLGFEILEEDRTLVVTKEDLPFLKIHFPNGEIRVQLLDGWFSYQYGVKQHTQKLSAQWQGKLNEKGRMFLWEFESSILDPEMKGGKYVIARA